MSLKEEGLITTKQWHIHVHSYKAFTKHVELYLNTKIEETLIVIFQERPKNLTNISKM